MIHAIGYFKATMGQCVSVHPVMSPPYRGIIPTCGRNSDADHVQNHVNEVVAAQMRDQVRCLQRRLQHTQRLIAEEQQTLLRVRAERVRKTQQWVKEQEKWLDAQNERLLGTRKTIED